jgi:hypothetical protein
MLPLDVLMSLMLDTVLKFAAFAACVVGLITAAKWVDAVRHPLPPAGWVCWQVTRSTSVGSRHDATCEPAEGWHLEDWPGVGKVSVPDDARPARRYPVQD